MFELCSKVLPLWRYEVKNISHKWLFSTFLHFPPWKQHDDFNTVRKVRDRATILVLWEIWPKKGSVYLERDNDTDRLQKSVYIYTFLFTGTYTGLFCHNPVESRLNSTGFQWIPLESGGIQRNGCIPAGICGASKITGHQQIIRYTWNYTVEALWTDPHPKEHGHIHPLCKRYRWMGPGYMA